MNSNLSRDFPLSRLLTLRTVTGLRIIDLFVNLFFGIGTKSYPNSYLLMIISPFAIIGRFYCSLTHMTERIQVPWCNGLIFYHSCPHHHYDHYWPWWLPSFTAVWNKVTHARHPSLRKGNFLNKGFPLVIVASVMPDLPLLSGNSCLFCCFEPSTWAAPEGGKQLKV